MIMQQDLETLIGVIRDQRDLINDLKAQLKQEDFDFSQTHRTLQKHKKDLHNFLCICDDVSILWDKYMESLALQEDINNEI